jgi:Tol biopolymer transport system component
VTRFARLVFAVLLGAAIAAPPAAATFAGSNGKIAYSFGGIWVVEPDGSGNTRLTRRPPEGWHVDPAWSPDGTRIAFVGWYPSPSRWAADLYVMYADGTRVTRLLSEQDALFASPSWSPDGTKIAFERTAFTADRSARPAIHVVRSDGTGERKLVDDGAHPAWSPRGTKIAFARGSSIWVVNPDGSEQRELPGKNELPVRDDGRELPFVALGPDWSPDASRIAFYRGFWYHENGEPPYDIGYVMDADGGSLNRVGGSEPSWSPDGTKIVHTGGGDASPMWVEDAETGEYVQLEANEPANDPAWQPLPDKPINVSPPSVRGSPRVGEVLRASVGYWVGRPPLVYSFAWEVCNARGRDCEKHRTRSAVDSVLFWSPESAGRTVRVVVTAASAAGEASARSGATAPLGLVIAGRSERVLTGSLGSDVIQGGARSDTIDGKEGRDLLYGGLGDDLIHGGTGNDRLFGGRGNDRLYGGNGRDRLLAGPGHDRVSARDGERDLVDCGTGRDVVIADRRDLVAGNCETASRQAT